MNSVTEGFLKRNALFIAKPLALIVLFFAFVVWLYYAFAPFIWIGGPGVRDPAVVTEEFARLSSIGSFLSALFQGNLGYSSYAQKPVWSMLAAGLGNTVLLIILSTVISAATGALVAFMAVRFKPKSRKPLTFAYSQKGYFFALTTLTGLILILLFSRHLRWFPSGYTMPDYWFMHPPENVAVEILGRLRHLALPMLTLAIIFMIRSFFVVWSRGTPFTSERTLRRFLLPLTTTDFACIVSAVVLIEPVFLYPGVGWLLWMSVEQLDWTLMVGVFIVILAIAVILGCVAVLFDFVQQRYCLRDELERKVDDKTENEEAIMKNLSHTPIRSLAKILLGRKSLLVGLIIIFLFVITGLAAPLLTPYGPGQFVARPLTQPVWYKSLSLGDQDADAFGLLGTDRYGQDVFSMILYAGRNTLVSTVPVAALAALIGLALGLAASYFGDWADGIVTVFADTTLALPIVPLLVVVYCILWSSPVNWALLLVLCALAAMASTKAHSIRLDSRKPEGRFIRSPFLGLFKSLSANFCFLMISLTLLDMAGSFGHDLTWGGILNSALGPSYLLERALWLWVPPLGCITFFAVGFLLIGLGLDYPM